jgi:cold shock CspA family protein
MVENNVVSTPQETSGRERAAGCVKWFNNKSGYGFVTVTSPGKHNGEDVFTHHSSLNVDNEDFYRYLVQGEYIDFDWKHTDSADHEWQAGNVTGVNGGKLMCVTRQEMRNDRQSYNSHHEGDVPHQHDKPKNHYRQRGSGPREGEEWLLVRRKPNYNGNNGNQRGYYKGSNRNWKGGNPDRMRDSGSED